MRKLTQEPASAGADRKKKAPQDFIQFDSLPDSAHVQRDVVRQLYRVSEATFWRLRRRGAIDPPDITFGARLQLWNVGRLRAALGLRRKSEEDVEVGP